MEYIVSIIITILFIVIYMITKPKSREVFTRSLSDEEFSIKLSALSKHLDLPDKTCKKEYDVSKFISKIRYACFLAKKHTRQNAKSKLNIPELQNFVKLIESNNSILKSLSKTDFSKLNNLPSKSGITRIENICRCILETNNYIFDSAKTQIAFDFFNKINTISYPEIENFHLVLAYLFLEKLSFLSLRVVCLIKLGNYAKTVTLSPKLYSNRKLYQSVKTNNVFLHFTSSMQNLNCTSADLVYFDVVENITSLTRVVVEQLGKISSDTFLRFYTPLGILNNFNSFSLSQAEVRSAFLTEVSLQSSKQNIDELAYVYSLVKYVGREEPLTFKSQQVRVFDYFLVFSYFKTSMKTLAIALKSPVAMELIFSKHKTGFKKIVD